MRRAATTRYYRGEQMRVSTCDRKDAVIDFMERFDPSAVAAGYVVDAKTGETVTGLTECAYTSGDWQWNARDTYHLRKYDLELNPEFIEYALSH